MSVEANVQLMQRWFHEVWNEGRIETIHELLSPDGLGTGQLEDGSTLRGPADFIPLVERLRGAFPDFHLIVEDIFGVDDKVVVRWSSAMTHTGDHLGVPASGKPVRLTGISILRIRDGKIIQGWDNWDRAAMMEQIGAAPVAQGKLRAAS